ncbi:MAG TPA: NAD(P)-binding protein [Thermoleophilaceae bacterium]|nr:NAD(P)-binding protein [Thermoleophilaceae bacterium]
MPSRWFDHFSDRGTGSSPPSAALARREVGHFLRRLVTLLAALTLLTLAGATILSIAEKVSWWHGIVWSVDIVATIGSLPHPSTIVGELVEIALISFGLGTLFYLLVTFVELFVAGHMTGLLGVWKMERQIEHMSDHYLICGFGRVGQQVARDFHAEGVNFVVIDGDADSREAVEEMEVLYLHGSASDDALLLEAGIKRARAIIACVDSDAENVFITLSARELAPDIEIIARASEEASERKLLRAGASDVISPYKASGRAMARIALSAHPPVPRDPTGLATRDQDEPAQAAVRHDG